MSNAVLEPLVSSVVSTVERARRALTAELGRDAEALEAGLVGLLPRILEAGRRHDLPVLQPAAFAIAHRVERTGDLGRETVHFGERQLRFLLAPVLVGLLAQELTRA